MKLLRNTVIAALFGLYSGLLAMPAYSTSEVSIEKRHIQLYPEVYSAVSKRFGQGDSLKDYREILGAITGVLKAQGWEVDDSLNKAEADIHIIFSEIPFVYSESKRNDLPEIYPVLPLNINANGAAVRHFTSPWMNATLYLKQDKIVGGIIVVPMAPFARLRELYLASQDNWDAILYAPTSSLDDSSISGDVYVKLYDIYYNAFFGPEALPDSRPNAENIKTLFAEKGGDAIMLGMLFATSDQVARGGFGGAVSARIKECEARAKPFYVALYRNLFKALLLKKHNEFNGSDEHYNFLPKAGFLAELASEFDGYNCFNTHEKE